ncbi:MAG: NAD(P)/FAD-dependent oxidoreductase, partial [Mucilaginibacter sp.]|nr:NAD(P)/FAD-dependent oxidoreductase [Mucilaginibacter sp.]
FKEIVNSEKRSGNDLHTENQFVLITQPTVLDKTRAPEGKQTAWAYCHVPNGSVKNMTEIIEKQI